MNKEVITLNECQNDGGKIHLYYNKELDVWIAFGLSGYQLRLFVKGLGLHNNFRTFSKEMQLPFTVVDEDVVKKLLSQKAINQHVESDYIAVNVADKVDLDAYRKWTKKLRDIPSDKADIFVETPVSKYVPRDRYIPDGMSSFARNVKRLIDFICSALALLVFSPLILICYIAVKMEDGGPAIFKQERIGRFGRPFNIYKFRSMRVDAEKMGPQLSKSGGDGDTRLTKVGAFIRAHHLDELPQLWNVFCGDMAFIGPRPERKFFIDQILEYDSRYIYLYQIRPGVTSYATLYNGYTDTMEKMLRRLEYDLYYLGHRSWWFDFKILVKTFCAIVFGKKF